MWIFRLQHSFVTPFGTKRVLFVRLLHYVLVASQLLHFPLNHQNKKDNINIMLMGEDLRNIIHHP